MKERKREIFERKGERLLKKRKRDIFERKREREIVE